MLLQLTVDLGDQPPTTRSQIAEVLGRAYTEALRRGLTGNLYTIDLSPTDDNTSDDTPEMARALGWGDGFAKGFDHGWHKAQDHYTPEAHPAPVTPALLPRPALPTPDERTTAQAMRSNRTVEFPPLGTLTGLLADTLTTPTHHPRHPIGEPPTANETTAVLPPISSDLAATLDAMQAAADRGAQPPGDRPEARPGAPVSAYDHLSSGIAYDSYEFPEYPDDRTEHVDTEGGRWRFSGVDPRAWQRIAYPAEWGPAPAGGFHQARLTGE